MSAPRPPDAVTAVSWLPSGQGLSARDLAWRHRFVCFLLGLHLPVLVLVCALQGRLGHALVVAPPVALLLALALAPVGRRTAALAATSGLLLCSALLVDLAGGRTDMHPHYYVVVAVVALYEDWSVLAAAVAFEGVQHVVVGLLAPDAVAAGGDDVWSLAAVRAGFVLAECAVLLVFWHAQQQAREGEERLAVALRQGDSSLQARLQETDRIRTDLIATVSHEFRTPLTGIRGAALTLLKRGNRLDPAGRDRLLHAVLEQQERLSRLLENMLIASRATTADTSAVTDVHAVAAEVAMLAGAEHPGAPPVSVLVEPSAFARIDRQALHQVLANLVDNAQVHGATGSVPLVTGGRDERGVWFAVSNDGSSMDEASAGQLFEPFAQADTGATRGVEGMGLGLYVVRRLVEVHGGTVAVRSDDGWVTVEVRLVPAEDVRVPQPAA